MELEIHYEGEWAALYIDGKLDRVGDSYLAEEKALALLGVKIVQNDAFMRGQTDREGVAHTLDEVAAYAADRDDRLQRAERLRVQAQQLKEEAQRLERGQE